MKLMYSFVTVLFFSSFFKGKIKKKANFSRGGMFMERWIGTAAICMNDRNEILMVLQGKEGEEKGGLYQVEDLKREKH